MNFTTIPTFVNKRRNQQHIFVYHDTNDQVILSY